jgi:hypothetical protein
MKSEIRKREELVDVETKKWERNRKKYRDKNGKQ